MSEASNIKDSKKFEKPTVLLEWVAPERVHIQRGRDYSVRLLIGAVILSFVLVLFKQYSLMLVVVAIAAVVYQINQSAPRMVRYQIYNTYIKVDDEKYEYEDLASFWFSVVGGKTVLKVRTFFHVPHRLDVLLADIPEDTVEETLLKFLPYEEHAEGKVTQFIEELLFPITK